MIDPGPFAQNPTALLAQWLDEARARGIAEAEAMALSTSTPDGRPSSRMVLCRGIDARGVRFFTNYESRKGGELAKNPRASLLFFWQSMGRQVRVEGDVEMLSAQESDEYFHSRPRGHQIGAWASAQSREVTSAESVRVRAEELTREFEGREIPRPEYWGGYLVRPIAMEFWQSGQDRLHDRLAFARSGEGWTRRVLSP